MMKLQRWISLLLCACMLVGAGAFAETVQEAEVTVAVPATVQALQDDTVVATVGSENVTWLDVKDNYEYLVNEYGSYYDMTDSSVVALFQTIALDIQLDEVIIMQQAAANGLDNLTEEEKASLNATADEDWESALSNYILNNSEFTETSTDEEKAAARAAAEAFYLEAGYSQEILRKMYITNEISSRVEAMATQDVVVTDAEIDQEYQAKIEADKALYENNIAAYIETNSYADQMAMYASMYGVENTAEHAAYKPAGFRGIKHILLPVDEALMSTYKDLQSRMEEPLESEAHAGEESADAAAETAAEAETDAVAEVEAAPATQADVDNAKANILASLSDKIEEINQKLGEGVSFDELIAAYGVNADGTPSDPGMESEPYKTNGYEVARESTMSYVPEFVEAAFSVDQIGDVSAPYLSDYGVHIIKYVMDVPAGPVALTDAQREIKRAALLDGRKSEAYTAKVDEWRSLAQITYTGVIMSIAELEALEAQQEADAAAAAEEWDAAVTEEAAEEAIEEEPIDPEDIPQG